MALENLAETARMWIELMRERGEPIPQEAQVRAEPQITVNLQRPAGEEWKGSSVRLKGADISALIKADPKTVEDTSPPQQVETDAQLL